ncbi:MAG: ABC transporter permease [Pseudomonadota bacterium]
MNLILLRLCGLVLVLLGVSLITFTLIHFSPGDKAAMIAHARYPDVVSFPPEILAAIRSEFHLEEPFISQFAYWLGGIMSGEFGVSYASGKRVWDVFVGSLAETATLALSSLTIGLVAAFLLASLAVHYRGTFIDRLAVIIASIGNAMPNYWLALLLILGVSVTLGWLPAYGTGTLAHLVLPALTLSFWVMASQTRLLRSFMLDAYDQPFIETLRLRGISEREIFFSHIVPHTRLPALTMIGLDLAALLEGTIIIELIFARSGLGSLLAGSVLSRDLPVMMFVIMFFAATYVIINTAIDLYQTIADPRAREAKTMQ